MGLVSQEPILFNDTIRANIAYGKGGDATEAEIIAAAELSNAHKFISGLHQVRKKNKGFEDRTFYFNTNKLKVLGCRYFNKFMNAK